MNPEWLTRAAETLSRKYLQPQTIYERVSERQDFYEKYESHQVATIVSKNRHGMLTEIGKRYLFMIDPTQSEGIEDITTVYERVTLAGLSELFPATYQPNVQVRKSDNRTVGGVEITLFDPYESL